MKNGRGDRGRDPAVSADSPELWRLERPIVRDGDPSSEDKGGSSTASPASDSSSPLPLDLRTRDGLIVSWSTISISYQRVSRAYLENMIASVI